MTLKVIADAFFSFQLFFFVAAFFPASRDAPLRASSQSKQPRTGAVGREEPAARSRGKRKSLGKERGRRGRFRRSLSRARRGRLSLEKKKTSPRHFSRTLMARVCALTPAHSKTTYGDVALLVN